MSDRTLIIAGRTTAILGAALALAGSAVIAVGVGHWGVLLTEGGAFLAFALFYAVAVWFVVPTQPRNAVVWIMVATSLSGGAYIATWALVLLLSDDASLILDYVPSQHPASIALIFFLVLPLAVAGITTQLTFGFLLFPDGKLPAPRWRPVAWFTVATILVVSGAAAWDYRPESSAPDGQGTASNVSSVLLFGASILALIALAGRLRSSSGPIRQQLKWVLWGASILIFSLLVLQVSVGTDYQDFFLAAFALAGAAFVGAYGIALGKYRLYDVDVVISRTFVYGTLAVFITTVYVGIVVGIGALFDAQDELWLGVVATVVVAIAFQPLRRRLQKVANRIVYGRRATPYEVLSSFSQGVAAVDPDVLTQIAHSVTEGTVADATSIWVIRDDGLHRVATWPESSYEPMEVAGRSDIPSADRVAPISHDGEDLGCVSVHVGSGQHFPPNDEHLLEQVASGLGLALRNLQLTDDLQTRVDQLRDSRRRIVSVQDQTRRALERDLHDGAQQRLVALKIKVGIGVSMAEKEGLGDVQGILESVKDETDQTIESLRDLARGIYPPLLEAEGLGPALSTQLRRSPIPVTVQAAGLDRYPQDLEATIYFCILEAVQNAVKHARANSVLVALTDDHQEGIIFEVRDDGIGFEVGSVAKGHGLTNLADRLDAVSGTLEVVSSPDHGTQVIGRVPAPALVEA